MRSYALVCGLAFLVVAVEAAISADEFFSGAKLLEICTAGEQGSDTGTMFCTGYISGVHDTISGPSNSEACIPKEVVLAEVQHVVVDFLHANEKLLDFGAATLVKKALALAYPCSRQPD